MTAEKLQYITDEKGAHVAIIIPIDKYNRMLEALEELEDIRDFDKAMASNEKPIPFEQAIKEIETKRDGL